MALQKLTDRQRAVLEFISTSIEDHGYPPTLREIGNHLGIRSTNGVNDHLRALERKGYLTREDMKSRTLRLVRAPDGAPLEAGSEDARAPSGEADGGKQAARWGRLPAGTSGARGSGAGGAEDDLIDIPILG
ncbi:MAG: hypothetical protein OEY14_11795, partial [Myxococcales bacterium]|nr:hypothetical protein [Myxococcales bacterium]